VSVQGFIESAFSVISVNVCNVVWMHVFQNTQSCVQSDLLISVSAQEIFSVGLVAEVNTASVTFRNDLVSINDVRESNGRIFLLKFRLGLVEPFFPVFSINLTTVSDLVVGDASVFGNLSESFRESSDGPVSDGDFSLHELVLERYVFNVIKSKKVDNKYPII
jgi:hypothetical protein